MQLQQQLYRIRLLPTNTKTPFALLRTAPQRGEVGGTVRSRHNAVKGHRRHPNFRRPKFRQTHPYAQDVEAAFFDLDKTVIARASMIAFGKSFRQAGMISRRVMARAAWNGLVFHTLGADEERMRKFRESALRITRGWDHAAVGSLVRDTLTDVIDPIVYDEALELIQEHRDAGRLVFIVSASPEEIVIPLASYLGADGAIASRARIDQDGNYTGEVDVYAYGPYKAEAIADVAATRNIDLEKSWAYSDSATDEPMLRAVGHPVAVNPDRELTRIATAEGWPILSFTQRVPLRDRVTLPPPGRIATGAVIATGVSAGLFLGWWLLTRRATPRSAFFRRLAVS
jgi:HAD superfamily hydrolase (TIGR01490 family)